MIGKSGLFSRPHQRPSPPLNIRGSVSRINAGNYLYFLYWDDPLNDGNGQIIKYILIDINAGSFETTASPFFINLRINFTDWVVYAVNEYGTSDPSSTLSLSK